MIPAIVPNDPGCLSILTRIIPGTPVQALGDVPPAMAGAKWADVREWRVFLWYNGQGFTCECLKTETAKPWALERLVGHRVLHPEMWRLVRPALKS